MYGDVLGREYTQLNIFNCHAPNVIMRVSLNEIVENQQSQKRPASSCNALEHSLATAIHFDRPNMSFFSYHLPLMFREGPLERADYLPTGFTLVRDFESREGHVQLVQSKQSPRELRIIKSVKHNDKQTPPAEARVLGNLPEIHTNIIRLFCCDYNPRYEHGQMLFEHCNGGDLFQQSKHRRATPIFALHVVISVAEALAFIHHGLVHREGYIYERAAFRGICYEPLVYQDVKVDNVFLRFPGSQGGGLPDVVLADFGHANPASQTVPGS
jgi:serine/threonine protein kinase